MISSPILEPMPRVALLQQLLSRLDLFLACQKDEDVAWGLPRVDHERRDHSRFQVIRLRMTERASVLQGTQRLPLLGKPGSVCLAQLSRRC